MEYNIGDIVEPKNTSMLEVNFGRLTRVGVDFKLKLPRVWPYYCS